jgi:hypothetical protein
MEAEDCHLNHVSTLMMETEEISETLVLSSTLTRLMARENVSAFIRLDDLNTLILRILFIMIY